MHVNRFAQPGLSGILGLYVLHHVVEEFIHDFVPAYMVKLVMLAVLVQE